MNKLRIAVVGAGAIGGITAAYMAKAGFDVHLVCKHTEIAHIAGTKGLHITGVKGETYIPVPSVVHVNDLSGLFDLCLIATKAYDMPGCAREMMPYLKPESLVVSLQNGICTDALATVVGLDRSVGCVIGWGASMHGPGELEMTSTGEFLIGAVGSVNREFLAALAEALNSVAETKIVPDIYRELYSKLIVNSCITSLGAICGLKLGDMLKRKQARKIFLAIIGEAMAAAHAMKLSVPPFGGKLDYEKLMAGNGILDKLRRHLTIRVVGIKYRNLKSSSLQSLERGRPTEIDYFNGYISQKGKLLGVLCPVNDRLTQMVKEIEAGKRKIAEANLYDKAFERL
jgi:2-dehydropantoate 2-reductase